MNIFKRVLGLLPVAGFALMPLAQGEAVAAPVVQEAVVATPVSATLLSEQAAVAPGQPFWVAVQLKMDKGWDTYWQNPGDAGFPTQITWDLPSGFTAGAIQWPAPQKFTNQEMVAFGYTDSVMLLTEITPPASFDGQLVSLKAKVSWLACKESCEPGEAVLNLTLPVTTGGAHVSDAQTSAQFTAAKAALPKATQVHVKADKDALVFRMSEEMGAVDTAQFIPEQGAVIDYLAPQTVEMHKGGATLSVKRSPLNEALPEHVRGVLLLSDTHTGMQHAFQIDSSLVPSMLHEVSGFWIAFFGALVGGLILNVMPCVMPVIALKIFSFVKMAQERRSVILKHGIVFTAGVLVSFWLLSGVLLLLRACGQSVGWGFQLQEPAFVAILAGILFLLGLSLFGVFELGTSLMSVGQTAHEGKSPMVSSFMSGVLATLVATPCTGPLLGPALGFAMTLSAIQTLSIFTAMGLGMAFPYLFFAAFPQLVRYLPKPGNWMIVFKQIMGFIMMATVAWLIWVFGAQTGNIAIFLLLLALIVMAMGAWIFGYFGSPVRKKRTRLIATVLALGLIGVGGGQAVFAASHFHNSPLAIEHKEGWETYSPQRIAELQAAGTPVFVDFTAKWCLICQVNKVVLHSAEVDKLFRQYGVVSMTADWTKKDPEITQQLEQLGRTGVPLYVLYPAKQGAAPYILPQTLSGNVLNEYLTKIATTR